MPATHRALLRAMQGVRKSALGKRYVTCRTYGRKGWAERSIKLNLVSDHTGHDGYSFYPNWVVWALMLCEPHALCSAPFYLATYDQCWETREWRPALTALATAWRRCAAGRRGARRWWCARAQALELPAGARCIPAGALHEPLALGFPYGGARHGHAERVQLRRKCKSVAVRVVDLKIYHALGLSCGLLWWAMTC